MNLAAIGARAASVAFGLIGDRLGTGALHKAATPGSFDVGDDTQPAGAIIPSLPFFAWDVRNEQKGEDDSIENRIAVRAASLPGQSITQEDSFHDGNSLREIKDVTIDPAGALWIFTLK